MIALMNQSLSGISIWKTYQIPFSLVAAIIAHVLAPLAAAPTATVHTALVMIALFQHFKLIRQVVSL